jgi:hypothetical protein
MPLTLTARILAATAVLSGTTRGKTAASTGSGRSAGVGVADAELMLEGAGVLGVLARELAALSPDWVPMAYRFCRGNAAMAPASTLITTTIAAMTARTTRAIRLGLKGYAHLRPSR